MTQGENIADNGGLKQVNFFRFLFFRFLINREKIHCNYGRQQTVDSRQYVGLYAVNKINKNDKYAD